MNADNSTIVQEFYEALLLDGRLHLRSEGLPAAEELDSATRFLLQQEQTSRRSLAGDPPAPEMTAVRWAAGAFYRAAQFVVYRDLNEDALKRDLSVPCPGPGSPTVSYSVDLSFRFLPELIRLARAASENDPLTTRLMIWASEWPLSSIGVKGVSAVSTDAFIEDASLRALYVDRLIATEDIQRLEDPRVREAVQRALGAYPELAPGIAAALDSSTVPTTVS